MKKVSVLKISRNKEVVNRMSLKELAELIRSGEQKEDVKKLRSMYHMMKTHRLEDGQLEVSDDMLIGLPRICFAAELKNQKGKRLMVAYNGLVVLEMNGLKSYEQAVGLRNQVSRMPQTLMAFLGASGRSVKVVVRGELFEGKENSGSLPKDVSEIRQFHRNIYATARQAYQSQFAIDIEFLEPRLDRTVYLSSDPEVYFNSKTAPFYADTTKPEEELPVSITEESSALMPGRTVERTWRLNWLFIVEDVLGHYFELPTEERLEQMLMQIASRCLDEGIPMARAQVMTLEHPVFRSDELLVRKTFSAVYAVTLQEEYMKKHKIRPLKSIPQETLMTMKTEIFLNQNFDMRKNLLTGVAEYRERYSEQQEYRPLTEEVRNDMTIRARELGLKSWDQDVSRFINSTRIEQYDPVNTWLDKLPEWDGNDYIGELAKRVPTKQPHWEMYLRRWLVGMVAQWRESDKQLTGNSLIPLLIGRQGCGKTRFCKIILPPELRDYYNDKINFKNEFDLNIALTSFALINIDEFDKTTAGQQIVLKYLLSSSDVKFRPPYGKTIKQYRRYTSFIGTTNQMKPLTDPTGSRRFVCVEATGMIDFEDNVNHRQLFAQALYLFNSGERYWLDNDEIEELISENENYQRMNDLVEMIGETFRKPRANEGRWWSLNDISALLSARYANFDPKTNFIKIGLALSDSQFRFENRRTTNKMEYWLVER